MDEGYEIASYVVDLADRAAVYSAAEKVKKEVKYARYTYVIICSIYWSIISYDFYFGGYGRIPKFYCLSIPCPYTIFM